MENTRQTLLSETISKVTHRIAPMWSLQNFVAVNPFFGLADLPFEEANTLIQKTSGASLHMAYSFYSDAVQQGKLNPKYLPNNLSLEALQEIAKHEHQEQTDKVCRTLIDFYSEHKNEAWDIISVDYISTFCSVYFDQEQAFLAYPKNSNQSLFSTWVEDTLIDKTLSIYGLKNVKKIIKSLDKDYISVIALILAELQIPKELEDLYLHRVLMHFLGWASYIRQRIWVDELSGQKNTELEEFLAIVLCMEYLFFKQYDSEDTIRKWREQFKKTAQSSSPDTLKHQIHEQFEKEQHDHFIKSLHTHTPTPISPPEYQAIFCIDVRSEVIRRQLESVSPAIHTKGFAGFFGIPIELQRLKKITTAQCPVFFKPKYKVKETFGNKKQNDDLVRFFSFWRDIKKAWLYFKSGSVSCFSFMGPIGSFYMPKMVYQSFLKTLIKKTPQKSPIWKGNHATISCELDEEFGIPISDQIELALNIIKGMSLSHFSKLIAFIGHEASMQNNPYASALDCGACGGHSGRKNAEVAAQILNKPEIRVALSKHAIMIPESTLFVSGIHNTTTDIITLSKSQDIPNSHQEAVKQFEAYCTQAGNLARIERDKRFLSPGNILRRSTDWSQIRPEWGLAGCQTFIAAPREFTRGLNLNGRAFLHCYDWKNDTNSSVLDNILSAPVVVASWINLQYFASTVNNSLFGSGNKILHNVVSALGVFEGSGGDLRVGLPIQSVHDGQKWQHSPERLVVLIAAPLETISSCLAKSEHTQKLVLNGWIHLYAISETRKITHKYLRDGQWQSIIECHS